MGRPRSFDRPVFDVEYKIGPDKWLLSSSHQTEKEAIDAAAELAQRRQAASGDVRYRHITSGKAVALVYEDQPVKEFKQTEAASVNITFHDGNVHQFGPLDRAVASQLYDLIRQNPRCHWGIRAIELSTRRASVLETANPEGK